MNETEKNKENFRQRCAVLQDENASERFTVPMEKTATIITRASTEKARKFSCLIA